MDISLYIGNRKVDTRQDGLILFNFSSSDITDPAVVKNSYTQTITLPGTPTNDAIFGHYFRLDRVTPQGGYNALKRADFALYNEAGEMMESGYVRLGNIKVDNNGIKEYEITLYGGLGAFLYGMMYNEDGTKKNLSSLTFPNLGDYFTINRNSVKAAWDAINDGDTEGTQWDTINFAPAYNGCPGEDFDYKHAYYKQGVTAQSRLYGIATSSDGYTPRSDADGAILLEMENKHTEWEMQEFRSYLQRPVLNLKALLVALSDDSARGDGYHFEVSPQILSSIYFTKGWMTLGMIKWSDIGEQYSIYTSQLFYNTASPAEYLLGIVKMFGFCLHYEASTKTITLMNKYAYYDDQRIDLSMRMEKARDITPCVMDSRIYEWKTPMVGAYASEYEQRYKRVYGNALVNTGYEFDAETKDVLDGIVFKGAPDVLESSPLFQVFGGNADPSYGTALNYSFKPTFFEVVKWRLYKAQGDGVQEKSMEAIPFNLGGMTYSGVQNVYTDFFPKVQLHGDDNKGEDGMNILLFYNGSVQTPSIQYQYDVVFRITDDNDTMLLLNNGKPCWDASPSNGVIVSDIPSFGRIGSTGEADFSMDMYAPLEVATEEVYPAGCSIYDNCWSQFIADRFSKDAKVVRAKVDLRGLRVDGDLLRHFYWFDNCLWSMTKVLNHSLTTDDLTECEFIKVTDPVAYRNQTLI